MGTEADVAGLMAPQLELLLPHLDERSRRLVLGSVALAAGAGGVTAVARASGAAWQTVADGAAELESGPVVQGRVRRPGAGRKRAEGKDPQLVAALLALVEDSTRGDPQSPLSWTARSLRHLAGELGRRGTGARGIRWRGCCTSRGSACRPTPRRSRGSSTRTGTPSSATSAVRRRPTWPPGSR